MGTVVLEGIRKSFGSVDIIKGIDLDIAEGEFVVFVGPSGCGKSTMLRMIAGLETISNGNLLINGVKANELPPTKRGIAMVFQSYALYPNMSVYRNLAFGLEQAKVPRQEIDAKIMDVARLLKIEPLLQRRPGQLSGGQSQRVAIGRSIIRNPDIFLFDEPLSNLDAELRVHMRAEIAKLHKRLRRTTIYVTHDQIEAMTLADRIVILNEGRIEQTGTPLDLYNKPKNRFVAGFIGSPQMNFLTGTIEPGEKGGLQAKLPSGVIKLPHSKVAAGSQVTLGIRPEHWTIAPLDTAALRCRVQLCEQMGGELLLHCLVEQQDNEPQLITVKQAGQSQFADGEMIGLSIKADLVHAFDPESGLAV